MPVNNLTNKRNPGLAELLNTNQGPLQKPQGQRTIVPSVGQQKPIATTLPQSGDQIPPENFYNTKGQKPETTPTTLPSASPQLASTTLPAPPQPTPAPTEPTVPTEPLPPGAIDWSKIKVQGTDQTVTDFFNQNSVNTNNQARKQEIQNTTFEQYWTALMKDTSWFDDYWSKDQVRQAFLQGPDAIAALFFDGAQFGKFGINSGDLERARGNAVALWKTMQGQIANEAPDERTLAESGAALKTFHDTEGRAIARGYILQNGQVYITKDLRRTAETLKDATVNIPSLTDFMTEKGYEFQDITESPAWQAIQELGEQFGNPETQEQWVGQGLDQAGRILGVGDEEGYQERVGGLADLLQGGISGQQGFTPEETDLQDRQLANDIKRTREETKLIVESLGASGRTAQAIVTAEQISSQIANMQIQHRLAISEQNFARQQAQFNAEMQQYQFMVNTGQMNVSDFIQKQRENAAIQISVYGMEVNMIESANAQYLQEYRTELDGLMAHANTMYNAIMMELNLDAGLNEQMNEAYEAALAPYYRQLESISTMEETWARNAESRNSVIAAILGMIGVGVNMVTSLASGGLFKKSSTTETTTETSTTNNQANYGGYGG